MNEYIKTEKHENHTGIICIACNTRMHGEKAVYDHTYKELLFFKKQLDR